MAVSFSSVADGVTVSVGLFARLAAVRAPVVDRGAAQGALAGLGLQVLGG
ncbi:hypothetical protein GCM10010327_58880 [Streptomyces nitrosporeus]|nr:hypothetical protein GCM10010327_58880 [Streptomyces nitrosporeus]